MKGFKLDIRQVGLGAALGIGIGAGLGYLLGRRYFVAKLDAEVEQIKEHYDSRLKKLLAPEPEVVVKPKTSWMGIVSDALSSPVAIRPKDQGYGAGPNPRRGGGTAPDPREGLHEDPGEDDAADLEDVPLEERIFATAAENDKETPPYIISIEEAEEIPMGWQAICIKWYELDNALTDETGGLIPNITGTVGALAPDKFGGKSGSPHLMFVKNNRLEIIFEIEMVRGSYSDVVLGYGDPAAVKERAETAGKEAT